MESQPVTFTPPAGSDPQQNGGGNPKTAVEGVEQTGVAQTLQAPALPEDRPLTRKELAAEIEKWNLQQLKLRQKLEDRVRKAAKSEVERLRAGGATVSQEQENAVYQAAFNVLNVPEESEAAPALPGQSQPAAPRGGENQSQPTNTTQNAGAQALHPATRAGMALLEALDLPVVNQEDVEEAKLIDMSSPEKYLETLQEAARRKKARLGTQPTTRLVSLGSGRTNNPSEEATRNELANLLTHWKGTPEDVKKSQELRARLKQYTT
jgi:hypothetical protein